MLDSKWIKSSTLPKCKNVFGRTWDHIDVIIPDGRKFDGRLDTTWGMWIHFQVDGKWYKTSVDNISNGWIVDLR